MGFPISPSPLIDTDYNEHSCLDHEIGCCVPHQALCLHSLHMSRAFDIAPMLFLVVIDPRAGAAILRLLFRIVGLGLALSIPLELRLNSRAEEGEEGEKVVLREGVELRR